MVKLVAINSWRVVAIYNLYTDEFGPLTIFFNDPKIPAFIDLIFSSGENDNLVENSAFDVFTILISAEIGLIGGTTSV